MVNIAGKIITTAFFTALNEYQTSRVRKVLRLQRTNRGKASEDRIAIVGTSASVQSAIFFDWSPWTKPVRPTFEFGLFVEVPVHQDVPALARYIDEDDGCASLESNHAVR